MNAALKNNFDRIVAARERLLEIRAERVTTIMRLQSYLRARLDDFFTNVDPVSGSRIADLGADGSKSAGEMSLALAMFDGARMRIGVDRLGRFNHEAEPNILAEIGQILDFDVSPDFTAATVDYVPAANPGGRPVRAPFEPFVDRLVQHTLESIEREVAPDSSGPPAASAAATAGPVLQVVSEFDVARIARAAASEPSPAYRVEEAAAPAFKMEDPTTSVRRAEEPSYRAEEPAYHVEEPATPPFRSELPRIEVEPQRAPEPIRYSEKVRPLERPRSLDSEREMDRIAQANGAAVGMPIKRGLSFSVR